MTKTKLNPAPGYIIVEPLKATTATASGIIIPENNQDKPQEGTVLAIGEPVYNNGHEVASPVKVGDVVVYGGWNNKEYKENDVKLLIVKFDDIMATIK